VTFALALQENYDLLKGIQWLFREVFTLRKHILLTRMLVAVQNQVVELDLLGASLLKLIDLIPDLDCGDLFEPSLLLGFEVLFNLLPMFRIACLMVRLFFLHHS
jgi:hypothetical protein